MNGKYTAAYRRFKEIDSMIREGSISGRYKKTAEMAEALGVSKRTVERDLAYMSSSEIGLPIRCNEKDHTYYYTPDDLKKRSFGNLLLSNSDKQFIALARSLLLSFFSGTDSYREAYKTFDNLIGRLDHTQEFLKHPMREAMLLALPKKNQLDDIHKIIPFINRGDCITVILNPDEQSDTLLIRPIHVIYAWSSWYLLYIDNSFTYNAEDFKIIQTDRVHFVRGATQTENASIPRIEYKDEDKKNYDFSKPVCTSCKIGLDSRDENDFFEYLAVDIYGNTCRNYSLKYRRQPDNSLILAEARNLSSAASDENDMRMFIKIMDSLDSPAPSPASGLKDILM